MSPTDLEVYGIYEGKKAQLLFEGGVLVEGEIITGKRNLQGKIILISFRNCTVKHNDVILFRPEWGIYDMAVGEHLISAFSGIADPNSFGQQFEVPKEKTHKITYSSKEKSLFEMYDQVKLMRQSNNVDEKKLQLIFGQLIVNYPNDWLLPLEIYELLSSEQMFDLRTELKSYLGQFCLNDSVKNLVEDGIRLIDEELT